MSQVLRISEEILSWRMYFGRLFEFPQIGFFMYDAQLCDLLVKAFVTRHAQNPI